MMTDKMFLLVKITISTGHRDIHHAIAELQANTRLSISSVLFMHLVDDRF
ncbi:hypothetical protein FHW89_000931 [Mucilaginibacter sp. SG564]|nr:hypothetical protein [Mucilaginibacter sp. SG564]